jgi:hypothetical protein
VGILLVAFLTQLGVIGTLTGEIAFASDTSALHSQFSWPRSAEMACQRR